jgi:stage II sporulation protein R
MSMKRFFYVLFGFLVLWMSWEGQLTSANVLKNGPIPQQSIRLRIIANSDSIQDQWLKREVRDAIVARMNVWVKEIRSYEEAKQLVAQKLPELQQLVNQTIRERGFAYSAAVDFGQVPFPTKLYGSYVYPAGNYEALRVRIGEAKGQNWWCVLFPPLCFIDMSNGDAVQAAEAAEPKPESESVAHVDESAVEEPKAPVAEVSRAEKFFDWRQERIEERLFGEEAEANETSATGENENEVEVVDVEPRQNSAADETQAVASAPHVEVRFYLWEKLASLF